MISKRYFGDFSKVAEILQINKIQNANLIHPGQKLMIPEGVTMVEEAIEINEDGSEKIDYGKWFGVLIVVGAAALLGREAMKQHKKNKAAKKKITK